MTCCEGRPVRGAEHKHNERDVLGVSFCYTQLMIIKAGLLLFRDGQDATELMFVRPHNKPFYVFPGGKQEDGETVEKALVREIEEELSATINNINKLGVVTGQTPDGRDMEMHLFTANLLNVPHASSEIAEIHWLSRKSALADKSIMTPMTLDHVMPFLAEKSIW